MDNNLVYSEFFDKYLKGKLSEKERIAFEKKVRQDPLLHSELKLQKEIYTALGESRKAALKSRLEQIPVNAVGWFNTSGTKLAVVISSVLIVATGSYFYISSKITDRSEHTVVDIEASYADTKLSKDNMTVSIPRPTIDQALTETTDSKVNTTERLSGNLNVQQKLSAKTNKNIEKELLPEIKRPDLNTSFTEETQKINYEDFEEPKEHIVESTAFDKSNVDIEAVFHDQYTFHYQFKDNKLYLYGNFESTLYKIIALNFDKGKKLFLEFNEHFYTIDNRQAEITPLQMIEDTVLLKELKKISTKHPR